MKELKEKNIGEELVSAVLRYVKHLRQLELEGLVRIIPNSGAYVVGISKEDVKDIYEIRARLEGLCTKWAADKNYQGTDSGTGRKHLSVEFHAAKGKLGTDLELDNSFMRFYECFRQQKIKT